MNHGHYDREREAVVKKQRRGAHIEVVIGTGSDHVAYLTMDDEALELLLAMV